MARIQLVVLFLALAGASASLRRTHAHAASSAPAAEQVRLAVSEAGAVSEPEKVADNSSHSNASEVAGGRRHFSVAEEVASFAARSAHAIARHPKEEEAASGGSWGVRIVLQLLFGLLYYSIIVSKYPVLKDAAPTPAAVELQKENEVMATLKTSPPNCLLALCCSGPRAAHTFHATGVMNYWLGLILMTFFPCCTLWGTNSCTNLNETLGGEKRNPVMGCACAFFCSCCVIAQDAEALDMISGYQTGFTGVTPAEETNAKVGDGN